jgi:hypothetical protein
LSIPETPGILVRGGPLTRRNRRWFVHLLSLALLFAQLGLVVHASGHLKADPHAAPSTAQYCGECLSFAPLASMVGGGSTTVILLSQAPGRGVNVVATPFVPRRAFAAYRSRAPPHLS